MKAKKIISILMVLPLLASCGKPKELVIPTVDVDSITPDLPTKPSYSGPILSDDNYDYLDFYELSDMHGAVNYEVHSESNYIGLPRLASYLDKKRTENPGGTFVVSSGDMFQGSADSNLTRGYMVNYAMNYMGFDSMAIGNHEFDWTASWLEKNANLSYNGYKIPFISANIVKAGTTETPDFLKKSTIIERSGYKVGIVGSIGETLKGSILKSCVEGFDFLNEVECVNAEATRLKEDEHCDVVILTSHNDIEMLTGLKNVDAVFGGHAHITKSTTIGDAIPAAQTKNYGQSIAHIQLKIDKLSKSVSYSKLEVDERPSGGLSDNEDVKKIMNSYASEINEIKDMKLGKCDETLVKDKVLKAICVESMYQGALKGIENLGLDIKPEDILATFHNINGGIRADIEKGDITYGDVYAPFPFDNEIVLYKIKGSVFKNKSGALTDYAVRREFNDKSEIDSKKYYYIVLTDFLALSENYFGGSFNITEDELVRTGKVVRDEVANFIYQKGKIKEKDFNPNLLPYKAIPKIF